MAEEQQEYTWDETVAKQYGAALPDDNRRAAWGLAEGVLSGRRKDMGVARARDIPPFAGSRPNSDVFHLL